MFSKSWEQRYWETGSELFFQDVYSATALGDREGLVAVQSNKDNISIRANTRLICLLLYKI
jgi:hypothetical protein